MPEPTTARTPALEMDVERRRDSSAQPPDQHVPVMISANGKRQMFPAHTWSNRKGLQRGVGPGTH
jgi:hypothetical protein